MTTERVDGDRRSVATREKCGRRVRRALSFDMDVVETPSPSETATPRAFDGRGDSTTTRGARGSAEEEEARRGAEDAVNDDQEDDAKRDAKEEACAWEARGSVVSQLYQRPSRTSGGGREGKRGDE